MNLVILQHMDVSCTCPACGWQNRAFSSPILDNDEAGAELWGRCGHCEREFRLAWSDPSDHQTEISAYRSPVVSTMLYRLTCTVDA